MISKITATFFALFMACLLASGQKIVVDTTSTNKYLIKKTTNVEESKLADSDKESQDLSFGERALSIGSGILNRLKARLNLEEAAESIKQKGGRIVKNDSANKEEDPNGS